jgi:hypothetical protein
MKEDIIRMAREANMPSCLATHPVALERFANLVRADDRDRATRENAYVQAKRNECVRICCEHWLNGGNAMECADAIRARGQAKDEMPLFDDWGKKW